MGIFGRLFGKKTPKDIIQETSTSSVNTSSKEGVSSQATISDEWRQFFSIVSLHESAESVLVAFVGNWPKELDPNIFSTLDMHSFLSRIREYQSMTYPLRSPFMLEDKMPRPTYMMVKGKIARASSMIDMIFIGVVPDKVKKMLKHDRVEPGQIVWTLIEYYSEFPLAKLIFILPSIFSASDAAKNDKAAIMIVEDVLIQIYKGVENLLFDVYSDLPEGGVLSDSVVQQKLETLLTISN